MPKQRMNALDIKAVIEELRVATAGMRLLNLYDINPRVYLLKFGAGDRKVTVFIEVGVRIHITSYNREKPKVPSQFTLKLRKHVRSWRLETIEQLGIDRVLDFKFGAGDQSFHFIVELYGKGNFVLTDYDYNIMMLLRSRKEDDVKIAVKEKYPVGMLTVLPKEPLSQPTILDALKNVTNEKEPLCKTMLNISKGLFVPQAMDHCLLLQGVKPSLTQKDWGQSEESIQSMAETVTKALAQCFKMHSEPLPSGGILFKKSPIAAPPAATAAPSASGANSSQSQGNLPPSVMLKEENSVIYDEYSPIAFEQFHQAEVGTLTKCRSFSESVDKFYFPLEMTKIEEHNEKKETSALTKRQKFYKDHQRRIDELTNEEEKNRKKGELISLNFAEVQEALDLINMCLASGITWEQLGTVLKHRRQEGLPVANIIHELHLERNTITLMVMEEVDEEGEDEDADVRPILVEVDIGLTAHANACKYFTMKKANAKKLEKTVGATEKAAAAAEKKGQRTAVKAGPAKKEIHRERPKYFFEKFYWFIATSGHLVLCAKDNQQTDDLVKRYLKEDDIYVHCDITGAPPCIVKARKGAVMCLRTLEEAGTMTVCRSTAWESKQAVSAWWVYASQVSKMGPCGEFLHQGIVSVRGKKNFMQAMPLVMGFAVVFRSNIRREPQPIEGSLEITPENFSSGALHRQQSPSSCDAGLSSGNMSRQHSSQSDGEDTTPLHTPSSPTASNASGGSKQQQQFSFPPPPSSNGSSVSASTQGANKKMSAKDRQKAKTKAAASTTSSQGSASELKSEDLSSETATMTTPETASTSASSAKQSKQSQSSSQATAQQQLGGAVGKGMPKTKRQLNKMKKIQKKYGEQDEEDRERAMMLLGNKLSKGHQELLELEQQAKGLLKKEKKSKKDKKKKRGGDDEDDDDEVEDGEQQQQQQQQGEGEDGDDELNNTANSTRGATAAAAAASKKEVKFAEFVEAEHEDMRKRSASFEDNEAQRQAKIASELENDFPFLTGNPLTCSTSAQDGEEQPQEAQPEEEFAFAMVMCGPYAALINLKYRVEITPGSEKKGAAAKQMLSFFNNIDASLVASQSEARMLSLCKYIKEDECTLQLVGSAKLHLKGAARSLAVEAKKKGEGSKHADPTKKN